MEKDAMKEALDAIKLNEKQLERQYRKRIEAFEQGKVRLPSEKMLQYLAAALQQGQIRIPCKDAKSANGVRLMLFRARQRFKLYQGLTVADKHDFDNLKIYNDGSYVIVELKKNDLVEIEVKDGDGWKKIGIPADQLLHPDWAKNLAPAEIQLRQTKEAPRPKEDLVKDKGIDIKKDQSIF